MRTGLIDDPLNHAQAIVAASESGSRFVSELRWQGAHVGGVHIGRVAEDQIKDPGRAIEEVGASHFRASSQAKGSRVAPRQISRTGIGIDHNDLRSGKLVGCQQAETAATAAQVQNPFGIMSQPRPEAIKQHGSDG